MNNFQYILDSSSRKFSCPYCGKKRFVRYVDSQADDYLTKEYGRCDREHNCGYHLTPRKERSSVNTHVFDHLTSRKKSKPVQFIPYETFHKSQNGYEKNSFVQYLLTLFDPDTVNNLIARYHIATSKHWSGATVFWQVDIKNRIRTGRIMCYDQDGHRDKYKNHWVHSLLYKDLNLKQSYFGEHLLSDTSRPVAIVESAKTAVIASAYFPDFIWLGCDGSNGLMPGTHNKHEVLRRRKVTLFPDIGKFDQWSKTANKLQSICKVNVSDLLETQAPKEHHGYDIADYLIMFDAKDFTSSDRKLQAKFECPYPVEWDEVILSDNDPDWSEYYRIAERECDNELEQVRF